MLQGLWMKFQSDILDQKTKDMKWSQVFLFPIRFFFFEKVAKIYPFIHRH